MLNRYKRFLALMLTVLMLVSTLPLDAIAEAVTASGGNSEWLGLGSQYQSTANARAVDSEKISYTGSDKNNRVFTIPVYFYAENTTKIMAKTYITVNSSEKVNLKEAIKTTLDGLGDFVSAKLAENVEESAEVAEVSSFARDDGKLRVIGSTKEDIKKR